MAASEDLRSLPLTYGARRIAERALDHRRSHRHDTLGLNHWLLALLERHGPIAEGLAKGLDANSLRRQIRRRLQDGETGAPLDPRSVVRRALAAAGEAEAAERHLAAVILSTAGYDVCTEPVFEVLPAGPTTSYPAAVRSTPTLDEFSRDLTAEARAGKLPVVVGRENEIREVCRTLCRRTKRNPALIGPAGTGKTAIVEGLAQRVVAGEVPEPLKNIRILALQASALVAGAGIVGELEKRMKALLAEAAQDGVVLFIDVLHAIMGSGGLAGRTDVGAQLKPALGRGEISCIGATTDDEYRRFIEADKALERRFRPIAVGQMSPEDTLVVLATHRDLLAELRGVDVGEEVLHWLVDFSDDFLRNRSFPDKAVDLLEECVAAAVLHGESEVGIAQARASPRRWWGCPSTSRSASARSASASPRLPC